MGFCLDGRVKVARNNPYEVPLRHLVRPVEYLAGAWLKINVCRIGATKGRPFPRNALNDCFQEVFQRNGNSPKYAFFDRSGALRASRTACPSPSSSNALGRKYKANSEMRCHPLRRFVSVSSTTSKALSLAWNSKGYGSSWTISGGDSGTVSTESVTIGTGQHGEIIDFLYRQIDAAIRLAGRDWIVRPVAIGVRSPRAGKWDKLIGIQVALSRRRGTWQMAEGTRIKSFSFFAKVCNLNVHQLTSRIPDLTVIPTQQWRKLRTREAVIELNEPPPILAIEVVSESTKTADYRAKRVEYNV